MQPTDLSLLPETAGNREQMQAIQTIVANRARFHDDASLDGPDPNSLLVAGVDQSFVDEDVVSAVVVFQNDTIVESVTDRMPVSLPYIPGYLAFREGPPIRRALEKLQSTPDVIMFDGNGRIHPRQAGLATHLGVAFDHPTIGVAKRLLCGNPGSSLEASYAVGTTIPIFGTQPEEPLLGYAVQTRQWEESNRSINPIYVSPGHRCNPTTAVAIVRAWCSEYKLPDPIRHADSLATQARQRTANG